MKITISKFLTTALFAAALPFGLQAQTITWGGTDGEYTTPGNWVGGVLPDTNGGETALITAGNVTYTPGGDLPVHNGGTLQVSGGSFEQVGGVAWMQFQGGNLVVDGGTFNQGTAGNFLRDASSSITVSAGELNLNGNLIYDTTSTGDLLLSGTGLINVTGEFKPIETFTMAGGILNVSSLISFADGPGSFNLAGGTVSVDGSAAGFGLYAAGGTKPMNFTTGSAGTLVFRNIDLTTFDSTNFLNNGAITLNGVSSALDFSAVEVGSDVVLSVIPEPSTILMTLSGMGLLLVAMRRRK